jgi:hypothetical protein
MGRRCTQLPQSANSRLREKKKTEKFSKKKKKTKKNEKVFTKEGLWVFGG